MSSGKYTTQYLTKTLWPWLEKWSAENNHKTELIKDLLLREHKTIIIKKKEIKLLSRSIEALGQVFQH